MKKLLIIFLIVCTPLCNIGAQVNLVLNPSFEIYDTCPYAWNQIQLAYYWSPIDTTGTPFGLTPLGSPEYINACNLDSINHDASEPRNDFFYHYPHTGYGMAQNQMYFDENSEQPCRRDYTQGRLSAPLEAGVSYCVTFYVALESASGYAINHIGAYFDNGDIDSGLDMSCCPSIGIDTGYYDTNSAQPMLSIIPQVLDTAILIDTLGWAAVDTTIYEHRWMKIEGSFTPVDASFKFITIGNFFDAAHTDTIRVNPAWPGLVGRSAFTWYLIDDISVVRSDAHADAGRDTFTSPGISVWIGNDTAAVGGGDGMPCWWYVLGSTTAIDSGGRIQVSPDSTTTYVEMMNLCGNITYDTVVVNVWPLGNSTISRFDNLTIYPNPAVSSITITNTVNITSVDVYNVYGQVVLKQTCNNTKVDVDISALISGLYFVKINGLYVKQILKE